ncbi:MAG: indole-3-glycerol phosphate synthase TrpC [Planctomycetia bacterium]|nr:indole-3-glycerol phosphate synthase TrpC [Planctomycetia bacterium]
MDVLEKIVAAKRREIETARQAVPTELLLERLAAAPPVRDFVGALAGRAGMRVITEVKKASPSAGLIRADFDPVAIARTYAANGAACISVLTDEEFFHGSLEYLVAVRNAVTLPVLRKDFLLDRYQVLEARAAGADCILLIAECLDDCTLRDLYFYASELGMDSLIEIYEPENLDRVLKLGPALLGINNRNLRTFVTDLGHSISLRGRVPDDCILISESGIHTRADVERLEHAGIHAMLVGETLMRAGDIGAKLRELLGKE